MNIVIIGAGKIGATLTEQLLREGHEITVVDTRTAALDAIGNTLDVMTVEGNGISMDTQVEAGVPSADLVIAVMSTDEQNLLSCLIAKRLGVGCWAYYWATNPGWNGLRVTWYLVGSIISGVVIAGVVVWYLSRALAVTGALERFESGRSKARV